MGSEALSRALMATGEGLKDLAGVRERREVEAARHARDMSLQRLRGQQTQDVAKYRVDEARALEQDRQTFQTDRDEAQHKRLMERDEAGQAYQDRRLDQQYMKNVEDQAATEVEAIDLEITKTRAMLDKARVEGSIMDDGAVVEVETRLAALSDQRMMVNFKKLATLRRLGDKRYAEMDDLSLLIEAGYPREIAEAFVADAEGGDTVDAPAPSEEKPEDIAPAAENPETQSSRQIMEPNTPDMVTEPINALFAVEPGQGLRDFNDLVRRKPWIRSPKVRERMGLPPLDETNQLMTAQ